jgi:(1->4)-alpha-D-glucan 1-alpha-D-glucosylmutase
LVILDRLWREVCNGCDAQEMCKAAKRQILTDLFSGAFSDLSQRLRRLAPAPLDESAAEALRAALEAYLIALPVYRSYVSERGVSERDRTLIGKTVAAARASSDIGAYSFDILERALLLRLGADPAEQLEFALRLQQLSGPLMAKAIEDTLFYRDFRLLALNEVGGDVEGGAVPVAEFHRQVEWRAIAQPGGLTATATHDTKRGEDARLRIAALTNVAELWSGGVREWLAASDDSGVKRQHRYMLFQALIGGWPAQGVTADFATRVKGYVVKALREGKVDSSWTKPDAGYETAMQRFIDDLLTGKSGTAFRKEFEPIAAQAALLGAMSSLTQVTLKLTLPGVPDIYQGCEGWDLSFVDPDNRRPVDYARFQKMLDQYSWPDWLGLAKDWRNGAIKLHLTRALLQLRSRYRQLFAAGDYCPLECAGRDGEKVVAFTRRFGDRILVVCACRSFANSLKKGLSWADRPKLHGELDLPNQYSYVDWLNGRDLSEYRVALANLFEHLPVMVLIGIKKGPKR